MWVRNETIAYEDKMFLRRARQEFAKVMEREQRRMALMRKENGVSQPVEQEVAREQETQVGKKRLAKQVDTESKKKTSAKQPAKKGAKSSVKK